MDWDDSTNSRSGNCKTLEGHQGQIRGRGEYASYPGLIPGERTPWDAYVSSISTCWDMTPRGYRVSWMQNHPVTMTSACVSDILSFWIDGYENVSLMILREKKNWDF